MRKILFTLVMLNLSFNFVYADQAAPKQVFPVIRQLIEDGKVEFKGLLKVPHFASVSIDEIDSAKNELTLKGVYFMELSTPVVRDFRVSLSDDGKLVLKEISYTYKDSFSKKTLTKSGEFAVKINKGDFLKWVDGKSAKILNDETVYAKAVETFGGSGSYSKLSGADPKNALINLSNARNDMNSIEFKEFIEKEFKGSQVSVECLVSDVAPNTDYQKAGTDPKKLSDAGNYAYQISGFVRVVLKGGDDPVALSKSLADQSEGSSKALNHEYRVELLSNNKDLTKLKKNSKFVFTGTVLSYFENITGNTLYLYQSQ